MASEEEMEAARKVAVEALEEIQNKALADLKTKVSPNTFTRFWVCRRGLIKGKSRCWVCMDSQFWGRFFHLPKSF